MPSKITLVVLAMALTVSGAQARDLLAPSNIGNRPSVAAVVLPTSVKEPFSVTRGQASHVCSISGLGHTSVCAVRGWEQRRQNYLDLSAT